MTLATAEGKGRPGSPVWFAPATLNEDGPHLLGGVGSKAEVVGAWTTVMAYGQWPSSPTRGRV
jgi:hypothetical protein